MLEKLSFKCGFRHSLEVFYTLEIIKASFMEKKNQLYEFQPTRQEAVKNCRWNPLCVNYIDLNTPQGSLLAILETYPHSFKTAS